MLENEAAHALVRRRRPRRERLSRSCSAGCRRSESGLCGFVRRCTDQDKKASVTEQNLSDQQSRLIADRIREELARRRMSRRGLADGAKISMSTLEKVLSGRRPFTLATTIRLEAALGVNLRAGVAAAASSTGHAPGELGYYSRPSVAWLEGRYVTLRPSFGDPAAIYAYLTEMHGRGEFAPRVPRIGADRCRLLPGRRGRGAQSVRLHLFRHQPQRPVPTGDPVPPDHLRRDVRHHDDPDVRPRLPSDPGIGVRSCWSRPPCSARCITAGSPPAIPATRPTCAISSAPPKSRSRCFCRRELQRVGWCAARMGRGVLRPLGGAPGGVWWSPIRIGSGGAAA